MINTFATFHVLPDRTAEFENLHRRMLEQLCARPGCIQVKVHRSISDPNEYVVYGTWESKEAWVKAHQTTADFRELFNSLPVSGHTVSSASFFDPVYEFVGHE